MQIDDLVRLGQGLQVDMFCSKQGNQRWCVEVCALLSFCPKVQEWAPNANRKSANLIYCVLFFVLVF